MRKTVRKIDPLDVQLDHRKLRVRRVPSSMAEQNARVRSVEELVAATNAFDAAEQAVKDAAGAHDKAWSAALAAGWTEKNLREIGARAPGQSAPRARKRRPAATPPVENTEG